MTAKKQQRGQSLRQTFANPGEQRKQGLRHFQANRFNQAIAVWEPLAAQDAPVATALAEAYFRRALTIAAGNEQIADLRRAVELAPDDPRYRYHLGLALHRSGQLKEASACYTAVLHQQDTWPGVGFVLALATLEQDPHSDITVLPGVTPRTQAALAPVQALLHHKAPPVNGTEGLERLWAGLGAIQSGDNATAQSTLEHNPSLPSHQAAVVQRYYTGVAAAATGDMDAALRHWQHVQNEPGINQPWLWNNLALAFQQCIETLLEADDLEQATRVAQQALEVSPHAYTAFNQLLVQVFDQSAANAARAGDWPQATHLWQQARQIVSASSSLGSPRTLLHNLALAYEAQEYWLEAAETWRALLRTRPRASSKKQPTAQKTKGRKASKESQPADEPTPPTDSAPTTSTDDQEEARWAWVRKRVIECYKQGGEPGRAVEIFKQAIKSDPDDLDMRLQLADALLSNEQEQAAHNELGRILERDSTHIEALLRSANIESMWGRWYQAEETLRKVLQQDPQREDVRREVARLGLMRGHHYHKYGFYDSAVEVFEQCRQLDPQNYQFPLNLARVAIDRGQLKKAIPLLQETLDCAADNPQAYIFVIECWTVINNQEQARAVLAQAEQNLSPNPEFYLDLGITLLSRCRVPNDPLLSIFDGLQPDHDDQDEHIWMPMAREALDKATQLHPDDPRMLMRVAVEVMTLRPDVAQIYAEKSVQLAPDEPHYLITLGLAQALNDQVGNAKKTLNKAAKMARKQGLVDVADQAEQLRREISSPFFRLSVQMGGMYGDMDDDLFF
jgi:tetratricopeptide (TPR) repeat protein